MKTNKMMRIASVLLVAVVLTTCAISGTFAKYTSSASNSDTARVAKWGFGDSQVVFQDLFSATYTNVTGAEKVIAPGTKGEATFTFEPAAGVTTEVAYSLTVDASESTVADSIKNNANIVWTLDGNACTSWDDLLTKIAAKSTTGTGNTAISGTVGWEWLFEANANDEVDTAMGIAGNAEVTLVIRVTATQVD